VSWLQQVDVGKMGRVCSVSGRCQRCGNPLQYADSLHQIDLDQEADRTPRELPCAACSKDPMLRLVKVLYASLRISSVPFDEMLFERRQFREGSNWGWLWVDVT
jgi:hypothetical protein